MQGPGRTRDASTTAFFNTVLNCVPTGDVTGSSPETDHKSPDLQRAPLYPWVGVLIAVILMTFI